MSEFSEGEDFDDDEAIGLGDDGDDLVDQSAVDEAKKEREQSHRYKSTQLKAVPWPVCPVCGGAPDDGQTDAAEQWQRVYNCTACDGVGHADVPVDDETFGDTIRGSDSRVVMLAKRYAIGAADLWSGNSSHGTYRGTTFVTPEMDF